MIGHLRRVTLPMNGALAGMSAISATLCIIIAGCGGPDTGTGSGPPLEGTYAPQFPPGASRLDRVGVDTRWEFSPSGTVITRGPHRTVTWRYEIRGNEIQLTGVDERNQGERRLFTRADEYCIWDGHGSPVDVKFCPVQ
ncbi:MAG: hypothetical protein KF790_12820 [Steroidobacteraceae bacterium]|nr:hypothetical protein [Steroidobacteraceae bacterium]MCW5573395.1 hypothetical protein [Steroidobacteraceae bacterium]